MNNHVSKRFLAEFLAIAMAFLLLLGCGSRQNEPPHAPIPSTDLSPTAAAPVQSSDHSGTSSVASKSATPEEQSVICYVTETGSKYHCSGCSYLAKSCIPIELEQARKCYGPCSKCCPPR